MWKNIFFHTFQIFDFESLVSIATEILSRKRGTAAAWYAEQSNTSRRIYSSGQEILRFCTQILHTGQKYKAFFFKWCAIPSL